ncbi:MAG TPA: bifunctional hydroxymethylpyrimidine kinase/phosphomethylpyrimidine kinase [Gemmatimonadales bacterium]|jgi:hydroxymethylpyrimidine/phosphomethylpyrimidine kinase|nr:bifunctional hydroxymethylpyrimidine kinase/phosphomethylpyrimidine kinase [Gemmatimonadales bacterium]
MQIALTIAGSDSGGGAGIQADLKTFQRFGVFGTSAITAVTAQNTRGVRAVHPVPVEILLAQLAALAEDLPAAALKTGMLATAALATVAAEALAARASVPYVLDPVIVATSGDRLLDPEGARVVRDRLVPLAALVTPNLAEAAILAGIPVVDESSMERAGQRLLAAGAGAALVKGGHLASGTLVDILVTPGGVRRFEHPRVATKSTHGTGCTLSAAITAGLALGRPLPAAVADAVAYVQRAIAAAPGLGGGRGPLDHNA